MVETKALRHLLSESYVDHPKSTAREVRLREKLPISNLISIMACPHRGES